MIETKYINLANTLANENKSTDIEKIKINITQRHLNNKFKKINTKRIKKKHKKKNPMPKL
jgi:hypothetical protein